MIYVTTIKIIFNKMIICIYICVCICICMYVYTSDWTHALHVYFKLIGINQDANV